MLDTPKSFLRKAMYFSLCLAATGCKKDLVTQPQSTPDSALAVTTTTTVAPATTTESLRLAAPFPVGAAVNKDPLRNNKIYRGLVTSQFNSLTPENAMKFDVIEWQERKFDFSQSDYIVNYAQQQNMRVHGHTLVWHHAIPDWLKNFQGDSATWESIFKVHIKRVVGHYKGRVAGWDVVNEAITDNDATLVNKDIYPGDGTGSIWRRHLGPDYIARAFTYAHEADPNALLFYNDYGNDNGGWNDKKLNAMINLVTGLRKRGITVSGFGVQMHINLTTSNSNITSTLKKLAATGLLVHISELDVSVNPYNLPSVYYTDALKTQQAAKYQFVAKTYRSVVPKAQQYGITTWEFADAYSESTLQGRNEWRLLYDMNYLKKPSYYGYMKGLAGN